MGEAGMRLMAEHRHLERGDALVARDRLHIGRFADDDGGGAGQAGGDLPDQGRRAQAADLLVIGKGQVHRPHQPRGGEVRGRRQGQGQKPFHVAGPAPIEPVLAALQGEGVRGPGLTVHRHHVGVAGEDDAALGLRPDRCQQVGLGAVGVGHPPRRHAQVAEQRFHVGDEVEIGIARGGVEGDQPAEFVDGAGREVLGIDHPDRLASAHAHPKRV